MADKDTTLRFKIQGAEQAKEQISKLNQAYERMSQETAKTSRTIRDLYKKNDTEEAKQKVDHLRDAYKRLADDVFKARQAMRGMSNAVGGSSPPPPAAPGGSGSTSPGGPDGSGGSGASGRPPGGPGPQWRVPGFISRTASTAFGFSAAALGLKGMSTVSAGLEDAKRYEIELSDLGRLLTHTRDRQAEWNDEIEATARNLGVSRSELLSITDTYAKLTGGATGTNQVTQFARGAGMDLHETASGFGQLQRLGDYGFSGSTDPAIQASRMAALFAEAVSRGGYQGRQEELLKSLVGLTSQQTRTLTTTSKEGVTSMLSWLSGMGNGPPGLKGEYGAQVLGSLSQGIQHPGGGGTGMFLMSQALGIKDYAQLQYTMEEGAFGPNQNLSKVMPYAKNMFPNPRMRQLFYKTWFPGTTMHQMEALEKIRPETLGTLPKFVEESTGKDIAGIDPSKYHLLAQLHAAGKDPDKIKKVLGAHELGMDKDEIERVAREGPGEAAREIINRTTDTKADDVRKGLQNIKTEIEKATGKLLEPLGAIAKDVSSFTTLAKKTYKALFGDEEEDPTIPEVRNEKGERVVPAQPWEMSKDKKYPSPRVPAEAWETGTGYTPEMDKQFKAAAEKYGVSVAEVKAIAKAESGFDPKAISPKGAIGIMQMMPDTARGMGIDPKDLKKDPALQIDSGVRYYSEQKKRFKGNRIDATAAYNAGPEAVKQYGGVPPYGETREFVEKVNRYYFEYLKEEVKKEIPRPEAEPGAYESEKDKQSKAEVQAMKQFVNVFIDGAKAEEILQSSLTGNGNNSSSSSYISLS